MFFKPLFAEKGRKSVFFDADTSVPSFGTNYMKSYAAELVKNGGKGELYCRGIKAVKGFSDEIKARVGTLMKDSDEAYSISVGKTTVICGNTDRALLYALVTLKQMAECGELTDGFIYDAPDKELRGYRVYTPGREFFPDFIKALDFMVNYRYNSIIIEVGGALEYERHPKINEKWKEFTADMKSKSGRSWEVQKAYSWAKNSIHVDNGFGDVLTHDEMKEIVRQCRERGLNVIPEVPSLSHSDYIVQAYPELNERKEDPYPDTYCPSNPKSYEVLFDVIDEVLEVFDPEYVNIGHDEAYTFALCDRCRGKSPVDLYVNDITKINDYLKSKGRKALMWSEKVYNATLDGKPVGGAANPKYGIPALYECAGRIPKDVLQMNWYYSICDPKDEKALIDMGYSVIYGNFNAFGLKNYRERISRTRGGFFSNWGSFRDVYMQRNGQYFGLLFDAYAFWSPDYDYSKRSEVLGLVQKEAYRHCMKRFEGKKTISFRHTTDFVKKKIYPFYDGMFMVESDWLMGNYEVRYTDGSVAKLPVLFGLNVSTSDAVRLYGAGIDCNGMDSSLVSEMIGITLPEIEDGTVWYRTEYENPCPDKEIAEVKYVRVMDDPAAEVRFTYKAN